MPLWSICPLAKVVPPTEAAPVAGISIDGIEFRWQFSHAPCTGRWGGFRPLVVLGTTPKKVPTPTAGPWQVAQPLVMPAWLMRPPAKVVPPTLAAPVAGISIVGAARWQVSQLSPAGMCGGVRSPLARMLTPRKDLATPSAWQVAQPVAMPVWSIWPPEKLT